MLKNYIFCDCEVMSDHKNELEKFKNKKLKTKNKIKGG